MKNKIAFLVPYPIGDAPSQRFRFEQYLMFLNQEGYEYSSFSFLDKKHFNILYQPGHFFFKSWGILKGFINRFLLLLQLNQYSIIFIHREVTPIGPPIFEWVISKILKKRIIYDFDDAIWLKNTSDTNHFISTIKRHSKVSLICKWSTIVMCGNHFLMNFSKKYNNDVIYMPTTIDTENSHNQLKQQVNEMVTIGWTGTHSTIKYLYEIEPILFRLQQELHFKFVVISDKNPLFSKLDYDYIPWNKKNEIKDLLRFDIGIMPLLNEEWAKGKCGFKALQYMALGIPSVISSVGVNIEIIEDGVNGYLVDTDSEWTQKLSALINSTQLRMTLGKEGRKTINEKYSVLANKQKFLDSLKKATKA
ncbi:MAG: group 1 glycosyl transferase [Flavobacteriales bacterium]|nr:MAG: group 1 glycosyl transferase [Flavobacteriales bacterium]